MDNPERSASLIDSLFVLHLYFHQGWRIAPEFTHEKYRHPMREMAKSFPFPKQA
jgi:hypothetical protein